MKLLNTKKIKDFCGISLILMIILLPSFVLAQETPTVKDVLTEDKFLKEIQKSYNEQKSDAPEFLLNLFGNERMNIYIDDITLHIIMVDGKMTEIDTKGLDDRTMDIHLSQETVKQILNQEIELKQALDQGLIKYQGVGFGSKIKFGAVKVLYKIISWFN